MSTETAKAYTVRTLAEHWSCSRDVVYDMIRRHELSAFRVGRSLRISTQEVERFESIPTVVYGRKR